MRLADGRKPMEGRVEILRKGHWGAICDKTGSDELANVACRQMGYASGEALGSREVPGGDGLIWMRPNCTGTETSLLQCDFECWGCAEYCWRSDKLRARCGKYGSCQEPILPTWINLIPSVDKQSHGQ